MHYFMGRDRPCPYVPERYLAVTAAHITHMLRDTYEDLHAGYFNIPAEFLAAHSISPGDVASNAYRDWSRLRVRQAREYFGRGRQSLRQVPSLRCRLAAHAYMARFEHLLDTLEGDDFVLRESYPELGPARSGLHAAGSMLGLALGLASPAASSASAATDGLGGAS